MDKNYQADWKRLLTSDCFYWEDFWFLNKNLWLRLYPFLREILNLRYINDLVDESGVFFSPPVIIKKVNLKSNFLQVYGILSSIPNAWRPAIRDVGKRLQVISSKYTESLFKTKRVTSFAYDALRKSVAIQPTHVQQKWEKLFPSIVRDWSASYSTPFLCTSSSKLRSFQYRIFHRIIGTNVLLLKMGKQDNDKCFFFLRSKTWNYRTSSLGSVTTLSLVCPPKLDFWTSKQTLK